MQKLTVSFFKEMCEWVSKKHFCMIFAEITDAEITGTSELSESIHSLLILRVCAGFLIKQTATYDNTRQSSRYERHQQLKLEADVHWLMRDVSLCDSLVVWSIGDISMCVSEDLEDSWVSLQNVVMSLFLNTLHRKT